MKIRKTKTRFYSRFISLSLCLLGSSFYANALIADDTEVFLGTSSFAPDPKVLFIYDNSGSMSGSVPGSSNNRMSVAKEALLDIVHDPGNEKLDIGLMLFNSNFDSTGNDSNNGARVVFAIQDLTPATRGTKPDSYNGGGNGSCSWSGTWPASTSLTRIICGIVAQTATPLEESLYEAYLYFRGLAPKYGNENRDPFINPGEGSGVRKNNTYYSPLLENPSFIRYDKDSNGTIDINDLSCERAYVVLMTDGSPYLDKDAHNDVKRVTKDNNCNPGSSDGQCLDELSKFMFEKDLDNNPNNNKQDIVTHTVGFTTNQNLLQTTASNGGGSYYTANNAEDLKKAFQSIFTDINDGTTSFTSPGTSNSAANDARSLDYVYNSFLKPANTPRWSGNIKKYRLDIVENGKNADGTPKMEFKIVDKNDRVVYDQYGKIISIANGNTDGNGKNYDVHSIWSDSADADVVEKGGAGAKIKPHDQRTIYIETDHDDDASTPDTLSSFDENNSKLTNAMFGAIDNDEREDLINWARGQDVDDLDGDDDESDSRWMMFDALHSGPVILNYGKRNNESKYDGKFSDIRLVFGTNGGFLHLLKDDLGGDANEESDGHTINDKVSESWAFIPQSFLSKIKTLRTNSSSVPHPYGLDSTVSVYRDDKNLDGNICKKDQDCNGDGKKDGDLNADNDTTDTDIGEGDDRVIIATGMRRGGPYYYAFDVTNPDSPKFLNKFTDPAIEQSWSRVQFGKVKYYDKNKVQIKTVGIFSAGYDSGKDVKDVVGSEDDQGNALFMVDLDSGDLIWSLRKGNQAATATTRYEPGLKHSIPATPKAIDANDDGILDRIYFGDTGGNIWRVDLFNQDVETAYDTTPAPTYNTRAPLSLYTKDSRTFWSVFKLANLGQGDTNNLTNDRRFFNSVDFVQTRDKKGNFDAILIGSGHRNNPNEKKVLNRFYMLRDPDVIAYKYQAADCETDQSQEAYDIACKKNPTTLRNANLSDVTTTPLSDYSDYGWRLDLPPIGTDKEKNLGESVTINGKVFFTTYSPTVNTSDPCSALGGNSYLYALDLHTAKATVDLNKDGTINDANDRRTQMPQAGGGIPSTPPVIIPPGNDDIYIVPGADPIWAGRASTQIHYWFKNSK